MWCYKHDKEKIMDIEDHREDKMNNIKIVTFPFERGKYTQGSILEDLTMEKKDCTKLHEVLIYISTKS